MTDFDLDFGDMESLEPTEAREEFADEVNMTAAELRRLKETERYEIYNERASGQETSDPPIPGGPTDDVIHLLETDDWGDDELAEADEWQNYGARTLAQFDQDEGEPLRPEADDGAEIHKGEMALLTWGFDMAPDDGFP